MSSPGVSSLVIALCHETVPSWRFLEQSREDLSSRGASLVMIAVQFNFINCSIPSVRRCSDGRNVKRICVEICACKAQSSVVFIHICGLSREQVGGFQ